MIFHMLRNDVEFRGVKLFPLKREGPLEFLDVTDEPKIISEPFKDRTDFLKSLNYLSVLAD